MNAVIIEDEEDAIELLSNLLNRYYPNIRILGTAGTRAKSVEMLTRPEIDIAFLDIQLKDCSIFDILEDVNQTEIKYIFTTAYEKHALKAFDYFAVGYILKPFFPEDLVKVINKVLEDKYSFDYKDLKKQLNVNSQIISISTKDGIERIRVSDIIRAEADRAYCKIYFNSRDMLMISKPLSYLESLIDNSKFFRPHLSHLINFDCIKRLNKSDGGYLQLCDDSIVPVSKRNKKEVLKYFQMK